MTVRMWALGLAVAIFTSSGAMACNFHKMTMASTPVVKKITVAQVPVDLWLLPYLS